MAYIFIVSSPISKISYLLGKSSKISSFLLPLTETAKSIGVLNNVNERQIGESNWVFVDGGDKSKVVTLFLRGGTKRVVDEVERSIVDATMAVKDAVQEPSYVYGCGYSIQPSGIDCEVFCSTAFINSNSFT